MTTSPIHVGAHPLEAAVSVAVADQALARATATAIADALQATLASFEPPAMRVVRLRTRKRFARLGAERVKDAMVVVQVTSPNARHLLEIVENLRAAGCAGVQLVWNGIDPARERVERHVFAVLERARSTPAGPPVVVAEEAEPALALRILIAHRTNRGSEAYR